LSLYANRLMPKEKDIRTSLVIYNKEMVAHQRIKLYKGIRLPERMEIYKMVHADSARGVLWKKIQKKYNMYSISKSWFYDEDYGIQHYLNLTK
jgi:hypothetical protein